MPPPSNRRIEGVFAPPAEPESPLQQTKLGPDRCGVDGDCPHCGHPRAWHKFRQKINGIWVVGACSLCDCHLAAIPAE